MSRVKLSDMTAVLSSARFACCVKYKYCICVCVCVCALSVHGDSCVSRPVTIITSPMKYWPKPDFFIFFFAYLTIAVLFTCRCVCVPMSPVFELRCCQCKQQDVTFCLQHLCCCCGVFFLKLASNINRKKTCWCFLLSFVRWRKEKNLMCNFM